MELRIINVTLRRKKHVYEGIANKYEMVKNFFDEDCMEMRRRTDIPPNTVGWTSS